jgi:hypothetical protein
MPYLAFVNMAGVYPTEAPFSDHFKGRHLALPAHMRLSRVKHVQPSLAFVRLTLWCPSKGKNLA